MSKHIIPGLTTDSLKDDFAQAHADVDACYGVGHAAANPGLVAAFLLRRSLERTAKIVQASARAYHWMTSDAGTKAKGRALGIEPRPGESMDDYRARVLERFG